MNENSQFTITFDQPQYDRLQPAQKQQLETDLKAAIQTVQAKYNSLNLNVTQHEVAAHR